MQGGTTLSSSRSTGNHRRPASSWGGAGRSDDSRGQAKLITARGEMQRWTAQYPRRQHNRTSQMPPTTLITLTRNSTTFYFRTGQLHNTLSLLISLYTSGLQDACNLPSLMESVFFFSLELTLISKSIHQYLTSIHVTFPHSRCRSLNLPYQLNEDDGRSESE